MNTRDIMITILAEVSGKAAGDIGRMIDVMCAAHPAARGRLEREVPDAEAEATLTQLRAEAPGILAWLERGAGQVEAMGSKTVQ